MPLKKLAKFIFEMGALAHTVRSGWTFLRISRPQNDAEHSCRVGQIAYILACMEGTADPCRAAAIGLFHEIAETRTGDPNKISKQYEKTDAEAAATDQTEPLGTIGARIKMLWDECEYKKSPAGVIAKDADYLEMMFTAKEYMEAGYPDAVEWVTVVPPLLKTASAKRLAYELLKPETSSHEWWRELRNRG